MTVLPPSWSRTHDGRGRIGSSPLRTPAAQAPRPQITVAGRFAVETRHLEDATTRQPELNPAPVTLTGPNASKQKPPGGPGVQVTSPTSKIDLSCRIAGVARPYIYALACMSPTLAAIANLSLSSLSEARRTPTRRASANGFHAMVGTPD